MFFCAILYRRQIWIVERSCCARNRQLQQWWAPKGLHRIHVEHQQLSSLSPLKGIRQNWSRFEILLPFFIANIHIRMHTYYEIVYTGDRTHPPYFTLSLPWRTCKEKKDRRTVLRGTSEKSNDQQSKKAQRCFPASLLDFDLHRCDDHYNGLSSVK